MKPILNLKNIRKIYHTDQGETLAVDDFSYQLNEGEFISIVGPSGCGKTSLLSILTGLIDKSDGSIEKEENMEFGYMMQDDCLFEFRDILSNCLLGLEIKGKVTDQDKKRVIKMLEKYGLKDFIHSYPKNLSGGMRQRVALIRTLAINPGILLLDEPFSALDFQTRLSVADDIYQIIKSEKKSAIMVTHNIQEALSMSDKVIVLSNRPSKIKNVYTINLDKKGTPSENRLDKYFNYYYDLIWKDLDSYNE